MHRLLWEPVSVDEQRGMLRLRPAVLACWKGGALSSTTIQVGVGTAMIRRTRCAVDAGSSGKDHGGMYELTQ
jgi:hypothetical protein